MVTHDGYGGLRSCEHRYGVGVKNGLKRGSEAVCLPYTAESPVFARRERRERGLEGRLGLAWCVN